MTKHTVPTPAPSYQIFYKIFHNRCVGKDGSRQLFLDVGANFGWFAVMAARMGCRWGLPFKRLFEHASIGSHTSLHWPLLLGT